MKTDNVSVGIFIDGGYYAKINEGFRGMAEVNLKALLSFIPKKIAELEEQIEEEQARAKEIAELEKYVGTDEYVEEVAKEKLGLVYEDEIIFKAE